MNNKFQRIIADSKKSKIQKRKENSKKGNQTSLSKGGNSGTGGAFVRSAGSANSRKSTKSSKSAQFGTATSQRHPEQRKFSQDASRYMGAHFREQGRYGSSPAYDDYGDESWS